MPNTIDLNKWHHAIHQVSGGMALHFNRATVDDVRQWAEALRTIAEGMQKDKCSGQNRVSTPHRQVSGCG
jgi:hypothetical protein